MGKTRDLFKKIRDTKGTFHAKTVQLVELSRERVVLRRAVRGIKMAVNLPVAAYLGVAIRMEPPAGEAPGAVSLVLEHRDPALSLPLYRASDGTDIVAEW